jgi:hypothetical protein
MLGDLWAMSHIASTVGHIYAMFPSTHELPTTSSWVASPARQFRPPPASDHDTAVLCAKVKEILTMASKELVDPDVYVTSESKAVVLITYHTLIIHLLFPLPGKAPLPDVLDSLATSGNALVAVANSDVAVIGCKAIRYATANNDPFTANVLALGIDAFSKALSTLKPLGMLLPRRAEFTDIAGKLLEVTKLEKMGIARRGRAVRKNLKAVIAGMNEDMLGTTDEAEYGPLLFPAASGSSSQPAADEYVGVEEPFQAFDPFAGMMMPGDMFQQEQEPAYPSFFPSPLSGNQHIDLSLGGFSVASGSGAQYGMGEHDEDSGWRKF